MKLFIISDDQLAALYDSMLDGKLKEFELVLYKIKADQEIKVEPKTPDSRSIKEV